MKKSDAEALINAIILLREAVTDKIASKTTIAYPTLKNNNKLIPAGTRINYNGKLMRAAVDLWDTEENSPESAPSLWEQIFYKDGYRVIPETITTGMAFSLNEYGWWNDILYKSLIDFNVYTPDDYPAGWSIVEQGGK